MLKVSTKGRYGLRVMVHLAKHYGEGPLLLSEISDREGISLKYAEHLIRLLKKTNLLKSYRGSYGGYELNTNPEEIQIKGILEALEGEINPVDCVHEPQICQKIDDCPTRFVWQELQKSIADTLSGIRLAQLIQ